ncbi:MAG: hypothetical protein NC392_14230 [Roseburia sp.]|nr:hypothetical protein [Roseburia sp.]
MLMDAVFPFSFCLDVDSIGEAFSWILLDTVGYKAKVVCRGMEMWYNHIYKRGFVFKEKEL